MNWKDILERAAWTFMQTFLAAILASPIFTDSTLNLGAIKSAAVAGLAAVLSLAKGVVASYQGSGNAALPG